MSDQAGFELDAKLARLMGWTELEPTYSVNDAEPMEWKGIPAEFPRKPSPPAVHDMVRRGTFLDGAKFYRERIWHGGMVYVPHFSTRIEHAFADYGPVAHMRGLGYAWTHEDFPAGDLDGYAGPAVLWAAWVPAPAQPGFGEGVAPLGEDPLAITLASGAALERIAARPAEVGA